MSWEEQVQLFLFTNISRGRSFQHRSPRKGGSVFPHSTGRGGRGGEGGEVGGGTGRGEKKVREGRVPLQSVLRMSIRGR